ncbi:MAG: hypothetical protein ACLUO4_05855 [Christensenellales bacterium]
MGTVGAKALKNQGVVNDLDERRNQRMRRTLKWMESRKNGCWNLNETHNHPTEVEPFGAATCLAGAIRDILASRPIRTRPCA